MIEGLGGGLMIEGLGGGFTTEGLGGGLMIEGLGGGLIEGLGGFGGAVNDGLGGLEYDGFGGVTVTVTVTVSVVVVGVVPSFYKIVREEMRPNFHKNIPWPHAFHTGRERVLQIRLRGERRAKSRKPRRHG